MLRSEMSNPDPYREIKDRSNRAMLEVIGRLRHRPADAADPFATAVRLAVAGNVIDFGARHLFDPEHTVERVLVSDLAIDAIAALRRDALSARKILYPGDDAGEIVPDTMLLEPLTGRSVTYAVRGGPVLNDATARDAETAFPGRRSPKRTW